MQNAKALKSIDALSMIASSTAAQLHEQGLTVRQDALLKLLIENELPGCDSLSAYSTQYEIHRIAGESGDVNPISAIDQWLRDEIAAYVDTQSTTNKLYFNFVMAEVWHKTAFCDYRYDAVDQMKDFLLTRDAAQSLKGAATIVFAHEQPANAEPEHAWKMLMGRASWNFVTGMRNKIRCARMSLQEFLLHENILAPISVSTTFQALTQETLQSLDWAAEAKL